MALLAPLVVDAPAAPSLDPLEPGITRGEMLRRKFATKLLEVSAVGLRQPSIDNIRLLQEGILPFHLPLHIRHFYEQCDGEFSSGFFAPYLEFLRCEYVLKWSMAHRSAVDAGALPSSILRMAPIFRDKVGNELFVLTFAREGVAESPVMFLDLDAFLIRQVSIGIQQFFTRLVAMRQANIDAGIPVCFGDFRNLSEKETEIALRIEPLEFCGADSSTWPMFDLASERDTDMLRDFVEELQRATRIK